MGKARALRVSTLLIGFLALSLAAPARAQLGMGIPDIQGIFHPIVGSGAAYDITRAKQPKHSMELTVVGKETVNGKDSYWLEAGIPGKRGGTVYMKMLMVVDQKNLVAKRLLMQAPGQPHPVEMNALLALMGGNQPQPTDIGGQAKVVGTESITVPAGTFECTHYRMKDGSGDFWINADVVPWSTVKVIGKTGNIVLTRQITGAKDHVTGTPIKPGQSQTPRQPQQRPN